MRIDSISLHNFQGIREYTAILNGRSADFYGDNATGKTTICNAISWMLYGKPSTNVKNFSPKNVGSRDEAKVTMVIILDDGAKVALQKTYKEVWKKKRGNPEPEYTGDTTEYYIDGRKVKENEYTSEVRAFLGEKEKVKILSIPTYFALTMPWEERLEILMRLYGDSESVDKKLLEMDEFAGLRAEMLGEDGTRPKDITEIISVANEAKKNTYKSLTEMDGRIKEAGRGILEDSKPTEEIQAELDALNANLIDLKAGEKSASVTSTTEINLKISEIKAEISQKKLEHEAKNSERSKKEKAVFDEITKEKIELTAQKIKLEAETKNLESEISRISNQREKILAEYNEEFSKQWDDTDSVCPTCKRPYPAEDIERLKSQFNVNRSKKLEEIRTRGKQVDKKIIADLKERLNKIQCDMALIEQKLTALQEKWDSEILRIVPEKQFELTEEYQALVEKINMLEKEKQGIERVAEAANSEYNQRAENLMLQIRAKQNELMNAEISQKKKEQVSELEAEKSELARKCEAAEEKLSLCYYFFWRKMSVSSESINSHFDGLRFNMFKAHINSEPSAICEAEVEDRAAGKWVPYQITNDARRIQAGIQIISVLSESWNMSIPLLIDNAESITRLPETNMQVLRFVVSEKHKQLTCVVKEPEDYQIVLN